MRTNIQNINADFTCKHCGRFVSAHSIVSGVVNRNHCPYCLHSRHVDLFEAGDRLCACKSLMAPVALTLKRNRDKYTSQRGGELMLVHRCTHCGELVINRIAADDDPAKIIAILEESGSDFKKIKEQCNTQDIRLINTKELQLVIKRLFGDKGFEAYQEQMAFQTT